jgi:hypothetical protein
LYCADYGPRSNPVYVDASLSNAVKSVPAQDLEHYIALMRAEDEAVAKGTAEGADSKTPSQFTGPTSGPSMTSGPPAMVGPPPGMSAAPSYDRRSTFCYKWST